MTEARIDAWHAGYYLRRVSSAHLGVAQLAQNAAPTVIIAFRPPCFDGPDGQQCQQYNILQPVVYDLIKIIRSTF
ncbi:hypothetical protein D3C78_1585060 [compost metagenome]